MGTIKNVTGIATQGRAHSNEYVLEYRIQVITFKTNIKTLFYASVEARPPFYWGLSWSLGLFDAFLTNPGSKVGAWD